MLEDKLSEEKEINLINQYTDIVNRYETDGWKSEEAKEFYQTTVEKYPSMKEYFDAINDLKKGFQDGTIK